MRKNLLLVALVLPNVLSAATYYVDSSVASSGNGLSWATAWKGVTNIGGVTGGDTVYISGGTSSRTYSLTAPWAPAGGSAGNPVTYAVGQDSSHNGTVIFDGGGTTSTWVYGTANWVTINGNDGAGNRHMTQQNFTEAMEWVTAPQSRGITLLYINFGAGDAVNLVGANQYEVGFCNMHALNDHAITAGAVTVYNTGYGVNKVHDNYMLLDQSILLNGNGADGFQWGNGLDFYNNTIVGNTVAAYPGTQHQDGIQTDAQFLRVYSNTIRDLGNFGVFINFFNNVSDEQIFNNVIYMSDNRFSTGYQQGIDITAFSPCNPCTAQRIVVVNNTIANFALSPAIILSPGGASWDSSDLVENNISYCATCGGIQTAPNVVARNNFSSTILNSLFAAFQAPTGLFTYNFHLLSSATSLIGQALNLTSLGIAPLDSDASGVARPSSGNWDIGAYQASGGSTPTQSLVPPTTLLVAVQ